MVSWIWIPGEFTRSIIIPLLKNKSGDLLRTMTAGICVFCMINLLQVFWNYKITIHYTVRGSHVFCAFIDFSKAFDRVNYWRLFNKLLDDNVSFDVVRLLAFWYSYKNVANSNNSISESFTIHNGTRQVSALTLYLFTRYIRDFLLCITTSNIGSADAWWIFWPTLMT